MSTKKKRGGNALTQSDNTFVHSNRLVEAHYKEALSHWEMFIFSKMCAMIDPADTDFKHYKIYIKDVLDHLNVKKGGHSYKYVVEAAQRLLDRRITIYLKNAHKNRNNWNSTNKNSSTTKEKKRFYKKKNTFWN